MKRVLILLLLLILLAIAGVGAAGHFGLGPAAKYLYKPPPPKPPPLPRRSVVGIGEVVTPIIRNHAIERQVRLDIDVVVEDKANSHAEDKVALIANKIRLDMLDFLPLHPDPKAPADRQAIHDRLVTLVKEVLGDAAVVDVINCMTRTPGTGPRRPDPTAEATPVSPCKIIKN